MAVPAITCVGSGRSAPQCAIIVTVRTIRRSTPLPNVLAGAAPRDGCRYRQRPLTVGCCDEHGRQRRGLEGDRLLLRVSDDTERDGRTDEAAGGLALSYRERRGGRGEGRRHSSFLPVPVSLSKEETTGS